MKHRVALHGALDGFEGWKKLDDLGKFPLLAERHGKRKYVYQARAFPEDADGVPLAMDFVQILGKDEGLHD